MNARPETPWRRPARGLLAASLLAAGVIAGAAAPASAATTATFSSGVLTVSGDSAPTRSWSAAMQWAGSS